MATIVGVMTSITWPAWGTTIRLQTLDPAAMGSARRIVLDELYRAERLADAGNPRSAVNRLIRRTGRDVTTSPELARLIRLALDAAALTGGRCDPTVGNATALLAPRRRMLRLPVCGTGTATSAYRAATGADAVRLRGRQVLIPLGVRLDLNAMAKADLAARATTRVARLLGTGVLLDLGGDVVTAGPAPSGGWLVPVAGASGAVRLKPGQALSSVRVAAIVDPATGRPLGTRFEATEPADGARRLSVVAEGLLVAKSLAVAAAVRGLPAGRQVFTRHDVA
jgi:thiamine biosynthesis lipoprotein